MTTNEMAMGEMDDAVRGGAAHAGWAARVAALVKWLDAQGERAMHPLVVSVFALTALAVLLGGPCKSLALTVVPLLVMVLFSLVARAETGAR